jgi:hypothetical protein
MELSPQKQDMFVVGRNKYLPLIKERDGNIRIFPLNAEQQSLVHRVQGLITNPMKTVYDIEEAYQIDPAECDPNNSLSMKTLEKFFAVLSISYTILGDPMPTHSAIEDTLSIQPVLASAKKVDRSPRIVQTFFRRVEGNDNIIVPIHFLVSPGLEELRYWQSRPVDDDNMFQSEWN